MSGIPITLPPNYIQSSDPVTPNLGLALTGLSQQAAENFNIIDSCVQILGANIQSFLSVYQNFSGTGSGNNVIYTVPAGYRAIFLGATFFNNSGSSVNVYPAVQIAGTVYQLAAASAAGNNAQKVIQTTTAYIAEAGESLVINFSTNTTGNLILPVVLISNTSTLKTKKLTSFSVGNNALYTVPSGSSAVFVGIGDLIVPGPNGQFAYFNASGGSVTLIIYQVPSGATAGTTNQILPSTSVGNNAAQNSTSPAMCLNSGDSIVVNVSAATAGQFAWATVLEFA